MVLLLSISVIGGDSSITMSTAAFFFAVVGNKLVLFGVDGKPIYRDGTENRNGSGGSDGDGIIPLISYEMFCLFVHICGFLLNED